MIKRNIKMTATLEQSKQVQEICFANGFGWGSGGYTILLTQKKFLFINKLYLTYCSTEEFFKEIRDEEVDASLFIRTQGTCVEETPNKN